MTRNGTRLYLVPLLLTIACDGKVVDTAGHDHRCQVLSTNPEWQGVSLELIHNDSRQCPQDPAIGEQVSTGGILEEPYVLYPSGGGDARDVRLTVHRTDNACAAPLGDVVGQTSELFAFLDWDYDNQQDWIAQPSVSFPARTGVDNAYDCPVFSVKLAGWTNRAIAETRLNYFGTQF